MTTLHWALVAVAVWGLVFAIELVRWWRRDDE